MADALRALMVGCGAMSAAWLRAAAEVPGLEIAGLVDVDLARAEARRDEFAPQSGVADDLQGALASWQPDLVFDCTVPEAHVNVAIAALCHGCHVLGEKPLADSMENARRILSAAKAANRLHAVIQNRRYDPNIRRLGAFLAEGRLGPITAAHSDFFIGAHFGGFRDRMRHVLLLDMAIHTFDAARFLTASNPVAVYCHEMNPEGSWYDHDAAAVAVFEMSGGLVYTYRGSWCSEGLNTSWGADWRLTGTRGAVLWDGEEAMRAEEVAKGGGFRSELRPLEIPPCPASARVGAHHGLLKEFVECVRTGAQPETDSRENIHSLSMVFGAIESARSGRRVLISEL